MRPYSFTRTGALAFVLAASLPGVSLAAPAPGLSVEKGSGKVITLTGPAANVFVADPKVAEVRPASATTLFVFGVGAGRTTVAALDTDGKVMAQYEVTVRPSSFAAAEAQASLARMLPGSAIRVQPAAKGMILTGTVASPEDAAQAVDIAGGWLNGDQTVDNRLSITAPVQVTLRVRVVEMARSVSRALGINWQALGKLGRFSANFASVLPLGIPQAATSTLAAGTPDVSAVLDALAQDNLVRILAEPNLTVMSGKPASFLAGGEFPIPVPQGQNQTTIEFKKYGVQLSFVPTVLSDGRINLHVSPEVSELSQQGAVTLASSSGSTSVPALTVRRAETTVELGSGQSFAIAGLLQDNVTETGNAVPLLGDVPVVGTLFRSTGFQRNQTELVIVVTPYVAAPVSDPARLQVAGQDFAPASDLDRILHARLAAPAGTAPARLPGDAGFIVQ